MNFFFLLSVLLAIPLSIIGTLLTPPIRSWLDKRTSYFANQRAGLWRVYSNGYADRDLMLAAGKSADILAGSARGLIAIKDILIDAIRARHAVIRIMVLSPRSQFVAERERQEGAAIRNGQIAVGCAATEGRVKEIISACEERGAKAGSTELRYYDTMPYCSLLITDQGGVWVPYLIHDRSGSTPAPRVNPGTPVMAHLVRHFEFMWTTFGLVQVSKRFGQ